MIIKYKVLQNSKVSYTWSVYTYIYIYTIIKKTKKKEMYLGFNAKGVHCDLFVMVFYVILRAGV